MLQFEIELEYQIIFCEIFFPSLFLAVNVNILGMFLRKLIVRWATATSDHMTRVRTNQLFFGSPSLVIILAKTPISRLICWLSFPSIYPNALTVPLPPSDYTPDWLLKSFRLFITKFEGRDYFCS